MLLLEEPDTVRLAPDRFRESEGFNRSSSHSRLGRARGRRGFRVLRRAGRPKPKRMRRQERSQSQNAIVDAPSSIPAREGLAAWAFLATTRALCIHYCGRQENITPASDFDVS